MITVTRIQDLFGLEGIAAEWTALVERVRNASPFHRPEWLIPWWRWFGSGQLHALAFRREERLVGFLPLFIHPWNGLRQVTLAGTGVSDRLGLIAEEPLAAHCARHAWVYLKAREDEWEVCDWQDMPASPALEVHAPGWFDFESTLSTPWMRADLPPTAAEFEASISGKLRRDLRRFTRVLEREGELRFETIRNDVGLLDALFRLHVNRWSHKGGPWSRIDQSGTQQFLREAMRRLAARGKTRMYVLRHRQALSGMSLGLMDRGVLWSFVTGMDPGIMRWSPGSLLLKYAIVDAIREGASAWDFLRGDEPYKLRWGARVIPTVRLKTVLRENVISQNGTIRTARYAS